jgi:hypothetical protein
MQLSFLSLSVFPRLNQFQLLIVILLLAFHLGDHSDMRDDDDDDDDESWSYIKGGRRKARNL